MEIVDINPIAFTVAGISVYWYGILFALSLTIAWFFMNSIVKKTADLHYSSMTVNQLDKFMLGAIITTVITGRLGHVLFFEPSYYLHNPLDIMMLRNGGMSFHGGLMGMLVYTWMYCKKNHVPTLFLGDALCFSTSVALITGRLANFVNQELVGKVWASEYGVIFKAVDDFPRYPTQLYEALTEGLLTFIILSIILRNKGWKSMGTGIYTAVFCIIYSSCRFAIEFFKDVDTFNLGSLSLTIGQILCICMFVFGIYITHLRKFQTVKSLSDW